MPQFNYRARTADGQLEQGALDAADADAVAAQLTADGLIPVAVELNTRRQAGPRDTDLLAKYRRVKLDDLILFARQMYTLTKAGVPIIRALRGLVDSTRNVKLRQALDAIRASLEGGHDLATSMAQHPQVFPILFSSIIQVGEGTGRVEESFLQIGDYLEREKEVRQQIRTALRYPLIVIISVIAAMGIVTLFVIPTFERLFARMNTELPLPTQIILGASHFAVEHWWHMLLAMVGLVFLFRSYIFSERGRVAWGEAKLKLPLVGDIILRATLARLARAFSMGYSAGVPLVQSLVLAGRSVENRFVEQKVFQLQAGIERGDTLTRSAINTELFTPLVLQMMAVGEESGAVDEMLLEVADYYEREVSYDVKSLSSIIEPIMIMLMGAMVLVLALGVFLPMWNMVNFVK